MRWIEQWRNIDARIGGILEAANFLVQAFQVNSTDTFQSVKWLFADLEQIVDELQKLEEQHPDEIPEDARNALIDFYVNFKVPASTSGHGASYIQIFAKLGAFRSRFEFLIRDLEAEAINVTDLAFEHLKRTIAVDEAARLRWGEAWVSGEVRCEKLGAVHLLGHGIWAFKVQGSGGITDLVYGEPLNAQISTLRRTSRVIVLTEWKVVRDPADIAKDASAARRQTKEYAAGVLGGLELKHTRYIPLVTQVQQDTPSDIFEGDICYRHVVIPVAPIYPSIIARRRKKV